MGFCVADIWYFWYTISDCGVKHVNKQDAKDVRRLTLRFPAVEAEKLKYWANRAGYSVNDFILLMLEQWIDIQNGNYNLPTLEVQRLNQLIESQSVMSQDLQTLASLVVNGFDSLLSLTRGDNYLLEDEDGEL